MKKIEFMLLALIWVLLLSTFSFAAVNNYLLYTSDYLGLSALFIATALSLYKPEKAFVFLLILLLLGLFDLISFVYFFNMVFGFSLAGFAMPKIQLYSFILLSILLFKKWKKVESFIQSIFRQTEEEKGIEKENAQNLFKTKFEKLTNKEIETKLNQNLVIAAIEALEMIKKEREKENIEN
jgi:hypothetical protein